MKIATCAHCVDCHRQRDAIATYETRETQASDSYYATLLSPTTHLIDPTSGQVSQIVEQPQGSYSTASVERPEDLDDHFDREQTCVISPSLRTYGTSCGPARPPEKWYCCCCTYSPLRFSVEVNNKTGRDGPKTFKLETKCLYCNHVMCDRCNKVRISCS